MRYCVPTVFGCIIALAAPFAARAQQLGDMQGLSRAFGENSTRKRELYDGTGIRAGGAADKKIAENCARWYLFRITHTSVLQSQFNLAKVHADFHNDVSYLMDSKLQLKNREFIDLFGPALVEAMKEVLTQNASGRPETVVNACMMMTDMGRLKQAAIADYFIGIVGDPKAEEVTRLYALKALGEFLPAASLEQNAPIDDKSVPARKARDIKCIDSLAKFIEAPVKTDGLDAEEIAAINYLRREAIVSLARTEVPAVIAWEKVGKLEGAAAPTLMRVIAGQLEPPPILAEKIEAAIGLCKMKYWNPNGALNIKHAHQPDYDPDLAVFLVGTALSDFIGAYKSDFENIADKNTKKKPRIPFKADAKRFEAALKDLAENAKGATGKADQLRLAAQPILSKIAQYAQVDNDVPFRQQVVAGMRPKNGNPFKKLKVAPIPLP